MTEPLADLAAAAGVSRIYQDQLGREQVAPPETLRAVLGALGLPADTDAAAGETLAELRREWAGRTLPHWQVVPAGSFRPEQDDWAIETEDGEVVSGGPGQEVYLEPGYHRLLAGGDKAFIMATPPRPPAPRKRWGITLPLYGLRTAEAGGVGDYADLARAVLALGRRGAAFVGVNPIHAGFPEDPFAFSPYSPSHRRRLNVLHVATGGPDPPGEALIDYPEAWRAKKDALERLYHDFLEQGAREDFDAWREAQGAGLERFAIHQALSERHGPYWSGWSTEFTDHASEAVERFAATEADRVSYHAFLQWRASQQLEAVGRAAREAEMAFGLYLDLAVGTHPHGAETWAQPEAFAPDMSLGAPPDDFSADGQKWGLAPLSPRGLEALEFRPLIETLRAQLRYAKLLRIDHILGFERAFWVPEQTPGTYVRMPRDAMLAIARIEAHRAGATIIGEDLGNVPPGLREGLTESGLLGCRLAMFEHVADGEFRAPDQWEERVLASFSTHDLPTYAGWRKGREIDWRERIGDIDTDAAKRAKDDRAERVTAFDKLAGGGDVDAMHAHLGRLASALVALQIEDILGLEEQPNLPGTTDEHPNWRRRLPIGADEFEDSPAISRAAAIMEGAGR